MKFKYQLFLMFFFSLIISLGLGGFLIINRTFQNELEVQQQSADLYAKTITNLYYYMASSSSIYQNKQLLIQKFQNLNASTKVYIGDEASLMYLDKSNIFYNLQENEMGKQIIFVNDQKLIQTIAKLKMKNELIYLETLTDITNIFQLRTSNYQAYCLFLIIVSFLSTLIIIIFSNYITKPIILLQKTNTIFANGDFKKRISTNIKDMKTPEFASLAANFNFMADHLESYIAQLTEYNNRQERFIANFTHELKTPLTSIIGYADLLRSFDVAVEKRNLMANYIYKEGKRLEQLANVLLQLILLKKDDFPFQTVKAQKFFKEVKQTLKPLLDKYQMKLEMQITESSLNIVDTLLKSLFYNLIDNACKASSPNSLIIIKGLKENGYYTIFITDFGKGIPKKCLEKVTTPFYRVDKSRARQKGGAGLGLTLCEEIAKIHNSHLEISSTLNKGTTIKIKLEVPNEK